VKNLIFLALLAPALILTGCADDETSIPTAPVAVEEFPEAPAGLGETEFAAQRSASGDIVDTAIDNDFSTLVAAVQAAGLEDALRGDGPFTVFAPTNEAFAALPPELLDALLQPENKEKLQQILTYHVIAGAAVQSGDLRFYQKVESFEGSELTIFRYRSLVLVDGVRVVLADVPATNGVIHVINKVLIPAGFTLEDPEVEEPTADIVDTAIGAGFDTLVAAVQAAQLEDALRADGPLTVFAPTEDAFAALPEGTVSFLLQPENIGLLQELLTYHVLAGEVRSTDLRSFQVPKMLNGAYAIVRKTSTGNVTINFSRVETPDVLATNGVIHVIDRVLIPYTFYGKVDGLPGEAPEDHPGREMELTAR
jgi:uncharacterized surface protein with fasciclin (FAS1) repeats